MNSMILDMSASESFGWYLGLCDEVGANVERVRRASGALLRRYQGRKTTTEQEELSWLLEERWYDSLSNGHPAWDVYADDLYLAELWACWRIYSRKYLREIRSERSLFGKSIVEDAGRSSSVVDLGCGPGLTTAALSELFPEVSVIGTNLPDLKQTEIAEKIGASHRFRVFDFGQVAGPVDLIFASEYFEHFQKPLEHLKEVVETCRPEVLLIANAFSSSSTGHFPEYEASDGLLGLKVSGREVSRRFNERLRQMGYAKVRTGLWNDRPSYWKRLGT